MNSKNTQLQVVSVMDCGPVLYSFMISFCFLVLFCAVPSRCSHVQRFATLWTVPRQSPVHGVFQGRILEWVAISFSMFYSQCELIRL